MLEYNPHEIEKKWQRIWEKGNYGQSQDFSASASQRRDGSDKPKHYHLVEFPYPSGEGLHVGHCMGYGASDAYCRMKRMQGFNVMYPMGWDAFGLPTENYAIKKKVKPQVITKQAVANFKNQMKALAYSFDWSREINTTDPDYYRWTQWIFLQFYKHAIVDGKLIEVADDDTTTPRLAFQAEMPVNWCPSCKIVLANEEVINGNCERCGAQTEKRKQKQWLLRITAYADRLIEDLKTVDYLEKIKTQQINWIGRSEGANIEFRIQNSEFRIKVFTTRADTLFGCTYVVLAPEHSLIENLKPASPAGGLKIKNWDEVQNYIDKVRGESDLERTELIKDKTGVKLEGLKAINPINNEEIDIYVADYCLANYGTGAVMAVPAHDQRDFEFAKKYGIKIIPTVIKSDVDYRSYLMGAEKISDDDLKKLDIKIIETKDDVRKIEIPKISINAYEKLIEEKITDGFWNEYVGKKLVFIFKHKDGKIEKLQYNRENKDRINKLCAEFTNDTSGGTIIEDWLGNGADGFYHDYLLSTDYGILIDSGEFDGLDSKTAMQKITEKLKADGNGDFAVNFKLRDWIFSRQHYWGEPIPIVHCNPPAGGCGTMPLDEKDLPLKLPEVENYEPTDTGESPLAKMTDWVNVKCPKCGGKAKRETDTMPNWAGSSWYFLAYALIQNSKFKIQNSGNIFEQGKEELKYWLPVDLYNGGMEHTTLHLLYSRFWHKFLFDLGVVPGSEPYAKRIAHGIILGPDGRKMSKSFGNIINPDDIVKQFGADTLRAYIMFIGPYDQESAWSTAGVQGVYRFLKRVWNNQTKVRKSKDSKELLIKLNQTIAGVTQDLECFRMNTVISKLMELNNVIEKEDHISIQSYSVFLRLLSAVCPHIASELWEIAGLTDNIHDQKWPDVDPKYLIADEIEIVVQINGKVKDRLRVPADIDEEGLREKASSSQKTKTFLTGKNIKKTIIVPGKLISLVTD